MFQLQRTGPPKWMRGHTTEHVTFIVSKATTAIMATNINKKTTLDYLVITAADATTTIRDSATATQGSSYGIMAVNSEGLIIKYVVKILLSFFFLPLVISSK